MQLDFKQPLEVLLDASVAATNCLTGSMLLGYAYFIAVHHKLPELSDLDTAPDVADRILQSGDSAACAVLTLILCVLTPAIEELLFRWAVMT
jgi:hypothetical protein